MVALSTGNVVITAPFDDAGGTDAGAVYLFNGATGALISTFKGSSTDDNIGSGGVTALSNGNFVVSSPNWHNAGMASAGAVTWGNGTLGISGTLSSSNSLVGSRLSDQVGINYTGGNGVIALRGGNYVVISTFWNNASAQDAGAVTWGSGSSGVSGVVSSSNSLVGSKSNDNLGSGGFVALSNGNYVISSPDWDNAFLTSAGAVTWGSGSSGVSGTVSSANSLIGSSSFDALGSGGVTALNNGNYVVSSPSWHNAGITFAGAVTWASGTTGLKGAVTTGNSLFGTTNYDNVGRAGVTALTNGNYVVCSPNWHNAGVADAGAVTWGDGTSGVRGAVSISNSLVGSTNGDLAGYDGVVALSNGNYVVKSPDWQNAGLVATGAVTWSSGSSGICGAVTSSNSLVGTTAIDAIGSSGVTALSNGNYVVSSPQWDNAGVVDAGAVTWGSGTSGVSGAVSSSNSLVGSTLSDQVGGYGSATALSNGCYVVCTLYWDNAGVKDAGAVTWGSGTTGVSGAVSSSNSLVGSTANDRVGSEGVVALSNGNYVVISTHWHRASAIDAGAVTWGSGITGVSGAVSSSNSLVGAKNNDRVGGYSGYPAVTALSNGNYVVSSPTWDNASISDAGAVTWASGTSGASGAVSSSNSLVGTTASDNVGLNGYDYNGVTALSNGNYIVGSYYWHNAGLVDAGAMTWGSGTSGVTGAVSSTNSLVGLTSYAALGYVAVDNLNGTYFGSFVSEGSGKVRLGSQANGLSPNTLDIAVAQVAPLTDGVSSVPFGTITIADSSTPLTFTITNPGTSGLTSLAVAKDGTNSNEFNVSVLNSTSIPVGTGTASFTVTFSPTSTGVKTAALHIFSNVIGEKNPFDISLTGTGQTPTQAYDTVLAAASLTGLGATPTATPYNDGVKNLVKYAFNMNLSGPDSSTMLPNGSRGLPAITAVTSGGRPEYIRVEFIRRRNSGLLYTPLYSTAGDLIHFAPMTATPVVTIIDPNWERIVVVQPLSLPLPQSAFCRVSITLP